MQCCSYGLVWKWNILETRLKGLNAKYSNDIFSVVKKSFEEEGIFVGATVGGLHICNNIANTMSVLYRRWYFPDV